MFFRQSQFLCGSILCDVHHSPTVREGANFMLATTVGTTMRCIHHIHRDDLMKADLWSETGLTF